MSDINTGLSLQPKQGTSSRLQLNDVIKKLGLGSQSESIVPSVVRDLEIVEKWRKICLDISEGRKPDDNFASSPTIGGATPPPGASGGPGSSFIKI